MSEEKFREAVLRALRQLEAESSNERSGQLTKRMYVICLKEWDERCLTFMKKACNSSRMEVCAVIPSVWKENGREGLIQSSGCCQLCMTYEEAAKVNICEDDTTVFPVVPRELIAKAALCVEDTFETGWIAACLEQGSRIVFLKSGLKKFTGKEAESYTARILSYYRTVLEYGIEIREDLMKDLMKDLTKDITEGFIAGTVVKSKKEVPKQNAASAAQTRGKSGRKVITAGDLENFQEHGMIVLNPGDQITDVAKDRAKFLKITIKKAEPSC